MVKISIDIAITLFFSLYLLNFFSITLNTVCLPPFLVSFLALSVSFLYLGLSYFVAQEHDYLY